MQIGRYEIMQIGIINVKLTRHALYHYHDRGDKCIRALHNVLLQLDAG